MSDVKTIRERFANVLENPDRVDLRNFIRDNFGEQDYIDFKKTYPGSDKLAKLIIALANAGGGTIIFGLDEEGNGVVNVSGLSSIKDKADFKSQIAKYLPDYLEYDIIDISYKDSDYDILKGKKFQLVIVQNQDKHIPFLAKTDGKDICRNRIYVRRGTETTEANQTELQKLINRRIDLNISTTTEIEFEEHLAQLKILYNQIKKSYSHYSIMPRLEAVAILKETQIPNKKYPKEDFNDFVVRMIALKKEIIEREVRK